MRKFIVFVYMILFSGVSFCFAQEQITITTYYPSPYGVYRELRSQRQSIGDSYYDPLQYCWDGPCSPANIDEDADLVVEGNVGIGTTTPQSGLHINQGGISLQDSCHPNFGAAGVNGAIDYCSGSGGFRFNSDATFSFSGGNVGIGTASPDVKLDVDGDIEADLLSTGGAGYMGYVSGGANGGTYKLTRYSSSKRYKENILDFKKGLEIIEKLRPVEFNWKTTKERDFGFIAEEAEEVDPLLVVRMNGEVETFKYMQLTAILTNAIKELKKENEVLEARIETLESKFNVGQ